MSHLPTIIDTIMHIINLCLSTSVFPSSCKSAVVLTFNQETWSRSTDIKKLQASFKFIFLSKLIGKVISSRILKHIADNDLIDKFQSAYNDNDNEITLF